MSAKTAIAILSLFQFSFLFACIVSARNVYASDLPKDERKRKVMFLATGALVSVLMIVVIDVLFAYSR